MTTVKPIAAKGYVHPTRFVNPSAPISSRNYPRPQYGNTYITNNTTIINNNYRYDSTRYSPHVVNFYGVQQPYWGDHWRYGCTPSPTLSIGIGGGGVSFGFYVYTPFYTQCVASPYYYDPYVPAYFPETRVVVWPDYSCAWDEGDSYDYVPADPWDSYGDPYLNYDVNAISLCYRNRNVNVIADFMGSGQVAVFANGHYQYSMSAGDFRLMMADSCRATRTVGYEVIRVRHRGPLAIVYCRHRYYGPDGSVHIVYVAYRMHRYEDRYAVTDYMTSVNPF